MHTLVTLEGRINGMGVSSECLIVEDKGIRLGTWLRQVIEDAEEELFINTHKPMLETFSL